VAAIFTITMFTVYVSCPSLLFGSFVRLLLLLPSLSRLNQPSTFNHSLQQPISKLRFYVLLPHPNTHKHIIYYRLSDTLSLQLTSSSSDTYPMSLCHLSDDDGWNDVESKAFRPQVQIVPSTSYFLVTSHTF
jgi:hypothetical protein